MGVFDGMIGADLMHRCLHLVSAITASLKPPTCILLIAQKENLKQKPKMHKLQCPHLILNTAGKQEEGGYSGKDVW